MNEKNKNENFFPVWEFAKRRKRHIQTIYRWIKEGKISKENIKRVKKTVERILIKEV